MAAGVRFLSSAASGFHLICKAFHGLFSFFIFFIKTDEGCVLDGCSVASVGLGPAVVLIYVLLHNAGVHSRRLSGGGPVQPIARRAHASKILVQITNK